MASTSAPLGSLQAELNRHLLHRSGAEAVAIRSIGAVFSLTRVLKGHMRLAMNSSHHARRIRARARRLAAGAWDMRMN
jgi:hypothetical protein